jgi:exopolyphosphatase/guanosine-5'-triphosphate,3'-diphosphate pyrophosphatase
MVVAVIDVGSHTVRLLVAARAGPGLAAVHEERAHLGLGDEVERRRRISKAKLAATAERVRAHARAAHRLGADRLEVVVTATGRRADNADRLLTALIQAAGVSARVLTAEEEGCLAFRGALAGEGALPETIAVCDVGGGSTEVVVGTEDGGPAWMRSFDVGATRLTSRLFRADPPDRDMLEAARGQLEESLAGFTPPLPKAALASGGTPRALRKLVGRSLGPDQLAEALRLCRKRSSATIAEEFGVDPERARTLAAGTLILAIVQQRLGVPLQVARFGLREGVVLSLLAEEEAAAA